MALDDLVLNISVSLDAPSVGVEGFGLVLCAGPNATFTERVQVFTDPDSVIAASTGIESTDPEYAAAVAAFSNNAARFAIGRIDVGDADLTASLVAIAAENDDWFGLCLTSRAKADIALGSAYAEANGKLFVGQSSDAEMLTADTTDPANVAKAAGYNRTIVAYHADDDEALDAALLANRLAVDPDIQATTWAHTSLAGITVDKLTATERGHVLAANGLVYLPLKGIPATYPGKVASGRFADEMVTASWLQARLEERNAQSLLDAPARGSKIPGTSIGDAVFESNARALYRQGVSAGHFREDALILNFPPRTDAETSARNRAFTGSMGLAGAVHSVQFAVAITND